MFTGPSAISFRYPCLRLRPRQQPISGLPHQLLYCLRNLGSYSCLYIWLDRPKFVVNPGGWPTMRVAVRDEML